MFLSLCFFVDSICLKMLIEQMRTQVRDRIEKYNKQLEAQSVIYNSERSVSSLDPSRLVAPSSSTTSSNSEAIGSSVDPVNTTASKSNIDLGSSVLLTEAPNTSTKSVDTADATAAIDGVTAPKKLIDRLIPSRSGPETTTTLPRQIAQQKKKTSDPTSSSEASSVADDSPSAMTMNKVHELKRVFNKVHVLKKASSGSKMKVPPSRIVAAVGAGHDGSDSDEKNTVIDIKSDPIDIKSDPIDIKSDPTDDGDGDGDRSVTTASVTIESHQMISAPKSDLVIDESIVDPLSIGVADYSSDATTSADTIVVSSGGSPKAVDSMHVVHAKQAVPSLRSIDRSITDPDELLLKLMLEDQERRFGVSMLGLITSNNPEVKRVMVRRGCSKMEAMQEVFEKSAPAIIGELNSKQHRQGSISTAQPGSFTGKDSLLRRPVGASPDRPGYNSYSSQLNTQVRHMSPSQQHRQGSISTAQPGSFTGKVRRPMGASPDRPGYNSYSSQQRPKGGGRPYDEAHLRELTSMGFSRQQSEAALSSCRYDVHAAIEYLLERATT